MPRAQKPSMGISHCGTRLTLALALVLACAPLAQARRPVQDMRDRVSGPTRYGSFQVRERMLASGARAKLIQHLDHQGNRLGSSLAVFGPHDGQLREKVKVKKAGPGSASTAAQLWSVHLRLTRSPRKMPTAAAAAVDTRSNKVYYGRSGKPLPQQTAPLLESRKPKESLEPWRVENCAEFKAVNQALLDGAQIQNLEVHTVRNSNGLAFPRCRNCQITTDGTTVTSDVAPPPAQGCEFRPRHQHHTHR
jgi:hypothetical protein